MAHISSETLHATTVAIDGRGVVIQGPSGSGKSDLALRLIDRGARLVSDDRSLLMREGGILIARAPAHLAGRIEVRGVGIATVPHVAEAPVALLVRLEGLAGSAARAGAMRDSGRRRADDRDRPSSRLRADRRGDRAAPGRGDARVMSLSEGGMSQGPPILLVTGLSGAGKSTVLKTLEDLGWEVVDNLPLVLLDRLLDAPLPAGAGEAQQPLAIGIGARTRDFDPERIVRRITDLREKHGLEVSTLFLDAAGTELERRYAETRRRHPLALDRPPSDGIARERELLRPLRDFANRLIDTTRMTANELAQQVRALFARDGLGEPTLAVMSFGFSRGVPANADLVFDMRFLRNPHWIPDLRPGTGLDAEVAAYVAADPAYEDAVGRIEELLLLLLPRYRAEGKSYVTVALGCTGGRHRSVHVADRIARRLRAEGFSPTVSHRDLGAAPQDSLEGKPAGQ